MKTALCLSGQPRHLHEGFKNIYENLIKPNDADVFIHCWFDADKAGKEYDGAAWNKGKSGVLAPDADRQVLDLYKPKGVTFETEHYPNPTCTKWEFYPERFNRLITEGAPKIQFSMFYSIMKSVELVPNGYDRIIRARFDAGVLDPLPMEEYPEEKLYFLDVCRNPKVYSDWVFFGPAYMMREACEVYPNMEDYLVNNNVLLCGEEMLKHHIESLELPTEKLKKGCMLYRDGQLSPAFGRAYG